MIFLPPPLCSFLLVSSAILERSPLLEVRWRLWEVPALLASLSLASSARASCLPAMLRLSSSAGAVLAALSADFYAVLAGVALLGYKVRGQVKNLGI